ncbi:MAG: hypothetical protein Q7S98_04115 [Deltaproteobacteria bacterium]|nr:hypothetical protein [Deltaproteobacteria bacterium]
MREKNRSSLIKLASAFLMALVVATCGSSSTSDDDATTATPTTSTLSTAYPAEATVTSPTAASGASASATQALKIKNGTVAVKPPTDEATDIKNILNATKEDDCKISFDTNLQAPNALCYGPTITYSAHPDALVGTPSAGSLPSGDTGMWIATETSSGEACVASKMNSLIGEVKNNLDLMRKMTAAFLCQAKFDSLALPEAGKSVDLTASAKKVFARDASTTQFNATVTLARDATDKAGRPIYTATMTGTMSAGSFQATIKHIPEDDANTNYSGLFSLVVALKSSTNIPLGNCTTADGGIVDAMSIRYNKSSSNLKMLFKRAGFCGADTSVKVFDTNNEVDYSLSWKNNAHYAIFGLNSSDGTGDVAHAWQAGNADDNARVLNVTVSTSGSTTSGCGYFGYGPKLQSTSGLATISKMICNWAGPGNSHTGVLKAQRQCFTKDTTGKFVTDTSTSATKSLAITYSPNNSCSKSPATAADFTYTANTPAGNQVVATSDTVTSNLIDLSAIVFTTPTAPSLP